MVHRWSRTTRLFIHHLSALWKCWEGCSESRISRCPLLEIGGGVPTSQLGFWATVGSCDLAPIGPRLPSEPRLDGRSAGAGPIRLPWCLPCVLARVIRPPVLEIEWSQALVLQNSFDVLSGVAFVPSAPNSVKAARVRKTLISVSRERRSYLTEISFGVRFLTLATGKFV
jgi:hypothetical protein